MLPFLFGLEVQVFLTIHGMHDPGQSEVKVSTNKTSSTGGRESLSSGRSSHEVGDSGIHLRNQQSLRDCQYCKNSFNIEHNNNRFSRRR